MTTWGAGEYPLMAERLAPAAAAAVRAAGVSANDRVLDVATGTGNAALLAAGLGADVVAVDYEPALLAIAQSRAAASHRRVRWIHGDAEALPVPDGWANVVLSVFGVMYAADHERAARELARGLAPDGRIVLAAWVPGSFMPALGRALGDFLPPPPTSSGPPSRWGDRAALHDLLAPAGLQVRGHSAETLPLRFADDDEATEFLVRTAGNVMVERERLRAQGRWTAVQAAVRDLVRTQGRHSAGGLRIDLRYLLATVARRGLRRGAS